MPDGEYFKTASIKNRVGHFLNPYWVNTTRKYAGYSDRKLYLPTYEELEDILSENVIDANLYHEEGFDCDDFAYVLKGQISLYGRTQMALAHSMGIGIAWANFSWVSNGQEYHAANWAMDSGGTFHWIEPQEENEIHALEEIVGGLTAITV